MDLFEPQTRMVRIISEESVSLSCSALDLDR